MGLLSFIKSRDTMGYGLALNFKGVEMHKTYLGAFLSLVINFIVLFVGITKVHEMLSMSEPSIISLDRSLLRSELNERGEINLHDQLFSFGVTVKNNDDISFLVPPEIGRFALEVFD